MNLITSYCRIFLLFLLLATTSVFAQTPRQLPQTILFGAAYYEEYAPTDRLDEDVRMMKATGITVVRIAESTWGTLEPQEGVYDFSHVDRVLEAMDKANIKVIVGTPTYAIPTWLAREHPDVLVVTPQGRAEYGRRQNMQALVWARVPGDLVFTVGVVAFSLFMMRALFGRRFDALPDVTPEPALVS